MDAPIVPFTFEDFTIRLVSDVTGARLVSGRDAALACGYSIHEYSGAVAKYCLEESKLFPCVAENGFMHPMRFLTLDDAIRLADGNGTPVSSRFKQWLRKCVADDTGRNSDSLSLKCDQIIRQLAVVNAYLRAIELRLCAVENIYGVSDFS